MAVLQRRTRLFEFGQQKRAAIDRERPGQRQLDGKKLQND